MIWDVIEKSQRLSYDKVANQNRLAEHQLILNAIRLRDVDLAKTYILSHLEKIMDTFQNEPPALLKS
jgi:DNA-binding FadR family transcriptional regulator